MSKRKLSQDVKVIASPVVTSQTVDQDLVLSDACLLFSSTRSRHKMTVFLVLWLVLVVMNCGIANGASTYYKKYYADSVSVNATIDAGALIETWSQKPLTQRRWYFTRHDIYEYDTAATLTSWRSIPALPSRPGTHENNPIIRSTGTTSGVGYSSPKITTNDAHTLANEADAEIKVAANLPGQLVKHRRGYGAVTFQNYNVVELKGEADAGWPLDDDELHTADSLAGVHIEGAKVFLYQGGPVGWKHGAEGVMLGGSHQHEAWQQGSSRMKDPLMITVTDMDTLEQITEEVMSLDLESNNASYSIDNEGIRFTINRHNLDSFVDLAFDATSSWVADPYSYGARLDVNGLTAYGETGLPGWDITETIDTIEAFFDFGAEGQPIDFVEAFAPSSFLIEGHTYSYSAEWSNGAFDIKTPEPCTLLLLGLGAIMLPRKR